MDTTHDKPTAQTVASGVGEVASSVAFFALLLGQAVRAGAGVVAVPALAAAAVIAGWRGRARSRAGTPATAWTTRWSPRCA